MIWIWFTIGAIMLQGLILRICAELDRPRPMKWVLPILILHLALQIAVKWRKAPRF